MTRYRIKQHVKIYGLWDGKKSNGGPSTPKRSRFSSSSESDIEESHLQETEEASVAPRLSNENTQVDDVCDDCPADFDSDDTDTKSATLKVMNPLCDPS